MIKKKTLIKWFEEIKEGVLFTVENWHFIFGILFSIAVFLKYIFGDDNLFEEIVELLNKIISGEDIDITPNTIEDSKEDLNQYIK